MRDRAGRYGAVQQFGSTFWSSVAKSAGSEVGGVVAGHALSALGLSGPSQEDADLEAIEDLLIDIDNELAELIDEVQALECLTAQDQSTLTSSIKNIQGLYDTYSNWVKDSPTVPCWEQSDTAGNVCFAQTGVRTWLNEVTDPANGGSMRPSERGERAAAAVSTTTPGRVPASCSIRAWRRR